MVFKADEEKYKKISIHLSYRLRRACVQTIAPIPLADNTKEATTEASKLPLKISKKNISRNNYPFAKAKIRSIIANMNRLLSLSHVKEPLHIITPKF